MKGFFRPHYMSWSEQRKIEFSAPEYPQQMGFVTVLPRSCRLLDSFYLVAECDEFGSGLE